MAWTPNSETDFKKAYLSGMTDDDLASLFSTSYNKIKHYLTANKDRLGLPARGTFEPAEDTILANVQNGLDLRLIKRLKNNKSAVQLSDLANEFDVSPKKIEDALTRLKLDHYLIDIEHGAARFSVPGVSNPVKIENYINDTNEIKFGVISDNHYCSKYTRPDVAEALYDIFEAEGITQVFNAGNWIDGEARFNKNDITVFGLGNQVKEFVKMYPKREGITTYYIAGDDHEGWYYQQSGVDIGAYAQNEAEKAGRHDLVYVGYMEADIHVSNGEGQPQTTVRIMHPGGGSSYALSYKSQKITESFSENNKPDVLLIGHYHKAEYLYYKGVHVIQAGCTQEQSPFMRKLQLSAYLGGWVVKLKQNPDGSVARITTEFISFPHNKFEHKS